MTLPKFEYLAPETAEEVCRLLKERGKAAKVMAGGTDLLVSLRNRQSRPAAIIGLKGIKPLALIVFDKKKGLSIGATALLSDVASHKDISKMYPAIAYAARQTATVQIRNMGTVVGNICNAAPSADNAPTLLAMGAELIIMGIRGEKRLPLARFFKGPGITALGKDEIVISLFVPLPPPHSGISYQHISARGKVDISAVGVGTMITMEGKKCKYARIALGGVAPVPMLAKKAEKRLTGKMLIPDVIEETALQAAEESKPISDVRASAEYRRKMVAVLTRRALLEAKKRAGL